MNTNTYTADVIPYLVSYHETFGNLPTSVIECTNGTGAYTCFGSNLKKKIEAAGGIENLLTSFIGRGAKKKAAKIAQTPVEIVEATMTKRVRPSRSKAAIAARQAEKEAIENGLAIEA
jgi:hypothetical protein